MMHVFKCLWVQTLGILSQIKMYCASLKKLKQMEYKRDAMQLSMCQLLEINQLWLVLRLCNNCNQISW